MHITIVSEGDWKVWVHSETAGKNGSVAMVAYGDKGSSGDIMLGKCSQGRFDSGCVDEFKVKTSGLSPTT